jgi:hypothetical protein
MAPAVHAEDLGADCALEDAETPGRMHRLVAEEHVVLGR